MSLIQSNQINQSNDQSNDHVVVLPKNTIRNIFNYLADLTESESGWIFELDNKGRVRLSVRNTFTGIHDVNRFKETVEARYVKLRYQTINNVEYIVDALEQPRRIHSQARIEDDANHDISSECYCYSYIDPETEDRMTAYVETRYYHLALQKRFVQGCVYDQQGNCYAITDFGFDKQGFANISIDPIGMIWDTKGNDRWADDLEGEDVEEEDEEDEIDFDALPPLQMYM